MRPCLLMGDRRRRCRCWVQAFALWRDVVGVPEHRIRRMGAADNFWASGATGGGPRGLTGVSHIMCGRHGWLGPSSLLRLLELDAPLHPLVGNPTDAWPL